MQLANATECYVIQVKLIDDISPLLKLIEDRNIVKIGINLVGDKKALYDEFGIIMKGVLDLDTILGKLSAKQSIGAKKAAAIFLNKNLQKSKSASTSNWEAPVLSKKQVKYAAEDAAVVYDTIIHLIYKYPFVLQSLPPWFGKNFANGDYPQ